ncbi:MAG: DUF6088 family protein [Paludibacteraceae bacterium]|nr:DUF6088 family protein [Paludibacteraceae bacterium]
METEKLILQKIEGSHPQAIFFTEDFKEYGTPEAIKTALHRLTKRAVIHSLGRGIYGKPQYSELLKKELTPTLETIAKAIAKRDHVRIIPTGSYALFALGLSTQVPMNIVYLTDGTPRKINIDKGSILFKRTTPRNLSYKGEISSLVVLALKEIGKDKLTPDELQKITTILKKEEYQNLKHDIQLAPQWIAEIMAKSL